jgi:hypothetical protein
MIRTWLGCAALAFLAATACGGTTQILTIKHTNLDGNSEYWVCEGATAKTCAGEREQQLDPPGYQGRVEIHSPPKACVHGAANIEVVLEGSEVKRVRYECAQAPLVPPAPSGLPAGAPSTAVPEPTVPGPGTGLPGGVP